MSEQDFGAECAQLLLNEFAVIHYSSKPLLAKIINDQLARRHPAPEPVAGEWSEEFVRRMVSGDSIRRRGYQRIERAHNAALRQANAELSRCRDALQKAKDCIKIWHGEVAWPEYQHSPEMKQINAALTPAPAPASSEVKS